MKTLTICVVFLEYCQMILLIWWCSLTCCVVLLAVLYNSCRRKPRATTISSLWPLLFILRSCVAAYTETSHTARFGTKPTLFSLLRLLGVGTAVRHSLIQSTAPSARRGKLVVHAYSHQPCLCVVLMCWVVTNHQLVWTLTLGSRWRTCAAV